MNFERIHVELTNRCNFSCQFCPDEIMIRKRGDMEYETFIKIIDEIAREKLTNTILLHVMGEPLLYPKLSEAVKYVHSKGLRTCLTTNGALMTGSRLEEIAKSKIDHIVFSVQTPTKESFEMRKTNLSFESYKETITSSIAKILNEDSGAYVVLSFLTTPFKGVLTPNCEKRIIGNKKEMGKYFSVWTDAVLDKLKEGPVKGRIISNRQSVSSQVSKLNLLAWNQVNVSDRFIFETRVLGDWVHSGLGRKKIVKAKYGYCEGLREHFGILWNGDLVFCCVDFNGETVFGNVSSTGINEALNKKEIQRVRKAFDRLKVTHPYCKKCLGDKYWTRSLARQAGSIFYFKVFRRLWKSRRTI